MAMDFQFALEPAFALAVRCTVPSPNPTQIVFESIGTVPRSKTWAARVRTAVNAHAQILGCAVRIEIICRAGSSDADLPKQNRGKRSVSKVASAAPVEQRPTRTGVGCRGEAAIGSIIHSSRRRSRDVTRWTEH